MAGEFANQSNLYAWSTWFHPPTFDSAEAFPQHLSNLQFDVNDQVTLLFVQSCTANARKQQRCDAPWEVLEVQMKLIKACIQIILWIVCEVWVSVERFCLYSFLNPCEEQ